MSTDAPPSALPTPVPVNPDPSTPNLSTSAHVSPDTTTTTPAAAPVPFEQVDIDHFAKVKLRVARIESAEAIPKSKKLLKLQVDVGPLGKRQILAGIAQHYQPETLIGRKIVIVANLKPASLMGHESQGMLLAGSSPDGSILALLAPDSTLPEGSEVR